MMSVRTMRSRFARRFARPLAAPLALAAALAAMAPTRAEAYDVLATPCPSHPLSCGTGAISFSKVDALPIQFNFDTGWVPSGSPLEVRITANLWAQTNVSLTGELSSSWPTAMTLAAPGDPFDVETKKGGDFGFHYGAEFDAEGMVDISVLGQSFTWQGNLPYLPAFDFEVQADQSFDAWGYAPGITLSSTTMPQQIASVDISSIIGSSIPGIDGGFALDVAVELDATYVTDRIVIDTTDGNPVPGGPITSSSGTSSVPFMSGGNIELDVHPEGTVNYDGVLHMIPTFYVSLLGQQWNIPIVDIPISVPITQDSWVFTSQRVHFPLPDLDLPVTELDFGQVYVGENKVMQYQLRNTGEAVAAAAMTTSDAADFPLLDDNVVLASGHDFQAGVDFIPSKAGAFTAQIVVASNDPANPAQLVVLKGEGVEPFFDHPLPGPPPPASDGTGGSGGAGGSDSSDNPSVAEPSTCNCRTVGSSGGDGGLGGAAAALGALVLALRSRPARRRRRGTAARVTR